MRRRDFVSLVGSAAVAWPFAARAQQHKGPVRLGFFPFGSPANAHERSRVEAFQQGLHRVGLIENQDVVLDIVWQGDDPNQAVSEGLRRGAQILIPVGSSASVNGIGRQLVAMRPDLATSLATSALSWWTSLESCPTLKGPSGTFGIPGGRTEKTGIERPSRPFDRPV
jgi:hypothetical protein